MSGFIKYFDNDVKNMSFMAEDENIYSKYSEIWSKIKRILNAKFSTNPIRGEKYLTTKVKVFNGVNKTTFTDDKIPLMIKNHYVCIAAINIDSVMKIEKKVYPQVYLEQYKYKLKKKKPVYFINTEVELSSESSYESN